MAISTPPATGETVNTFGIPPDVYAKRWVILGLMNVSLVVVVAANSSLNVALPDLQGLLNASGTQLQWIVDSYALVFAGLLLPAGALGDRFGRKKILCIGLATFATAAFMASRATDPTQLIAVRCMMGIGAAMIMPATLSIVVSSFPMHERPRAIAFWAAFAGVGGAIGPLVSGLLLEHFWPGSVFLINLPIIAVLLVLVLLMVPDSRNANTHALDPIGAVLSVVALVALVYGVIEGPEHGWTSVATIAAFVISVVFGYAFLAYERRTDDPMLDPALFRRPGFSAGSASVTSMFVGLFGMYFLLTQYLQFVRGYTPLQAGVRLIPSAIAIMVFAPQGPKLMNRIGVKSTIRMGFLLMAAGFTLLSLSTRTSTYLLIGIGLVLIGTGVSCIAPGSSQHIVGSVPLSKAGVGSAMNDVTREVGGALGIAIGGSIAATAYRSNIGAVSGLSDSSDRALARRSIGEAFEAGQRALASGKLDSGGLAGLHQAAGEAFVVGTRVAFLSLAGLLFVMSFVIARFIPDQLPQRALPDRNVTAS